MAEAAEEEVDAAAPPDFSTAIGGGGLAAPAGEGFVGGLVRRRKRNHAHLETAGAWGENRRRNQGMLMPTELGS